MGSHYLYQNPHDIQIVPGDEVEVDDGVIIGNLTTGEQAPWPIYMKPSLDMAIPAPGAPDLNGDTFSPEAIEQLKQGLKEKESESSFQAAVYNALLEHLPHFEPSPKQKLFMEHASKSGKKPKKLKNCPQNTGIMAVERGASLKEQFASLSAPYVNGMSIGNLEIRTGPTPLEITPEQTPLVSKPDPYNTKEPVIPRCGCGAQYRLNDIQTHRGRLFLYLRCGLCNRKHRMEFRPMGDGLVGNQYDEVELMYLKRKRSQ